jgi:hypothetical protein
MSESCQKINQNQISTVLCIKYLTDTLTSNFTKKTLNPLQVEMISWQFNF